MNKTGHSAYKDSRKCGTCAFNIKKLSEEEQYKILAALKNLCFPCVYGRNILRKNNIYKLSADKIPIANTSFKTSAIFRTPNRNANSLQGKYLRLTSFLQMDKMCNIPKLS